MAITRRLDASTPLQYGQVGWDMEAANVAAADYTPSDGLHFNAIRYGGAAAADIAITTMGGNVVTIKNVQPGEYVPQAGKKVMHANTTAADGTILAIFS